MPKTNSAYLSAVDFLNRRDILSSLFDIYEEEMTVMDLMELTGKAKPTDQPEYHNFVNDWLYKPATVASATLAASLTTDADDYSVGTITLTSAADAPIIQELGMQPATGSIFLVTNVVGAVVTVKSLNTVTSGDAAYTANWTANDTIVFFSNAYGEGTSANENRKSGMIKESNYIQIFKTKHTITDLADASKIELEFNGKPYYGYKQSYDAYRKHEMDRMYAFILGKKGKTFDKDGNVVYTTEGLDHYISDNGGILQTVASAGVVDKNEFRTLARAMDKSRCPSEYWMWAGGEFDNEVDDLFGTITETTQGGIQYNSFGRGNAKKKAIELGVNSVYLYGKSFHKKRLSALDHQKVTWVNDNSGNNVSKYPGYAYMIPTGQISVETAQKKREKKDRFCLRYMVQSNGQTSRFRETHTGALAEVPTNDVAELGITLQSTEGLMGLGVQQFARVDMNDVANY